MTYDAGIGKSIVPFDFDGASVRVAIDADGEPWFFAVDVCRELGLGNPSQAITRLDPDEVTLISTDGAPYAGINAVSEAGFYALVLGTRDRKGDADRLARIKRFKRWVTHEVLPTIRKTGSYGAPDPLAALSDPAQLRTLLLGYTEKVLALEATNAELAPKAEVYDRIVACDDTLGLREAHKVIREGTGVTERELVATMIRRGWIQRLGKRLAPACYGEAHGYVTSRLTEYTAPDGSRGARQELRITPKGLARLAEVLAPEAAA